MIPGLRQAPKELPSTNPPRSATQPALQVQASNLLELESNLSGLQRQYCKEVDKRIQAEEAKGKEEERLFTALVRTNSCCHEVGESSAPFDPVYLYVCMYVLRVCRAISVASHRSYFLPYPLNWRIRISVAQPCFEVWVLKKTPSDLSQHERWTGVEGRVQGQNRD